MVQGLYPPTDSSDSTFPATPCPHDAEVPCLPYLQDHPFSQSRVALRRGPFAVLFATRDTAFQRPSLYGPANLSRGVGRQRQVLINQKIFQKNNFWRQHFSGQIRL
jgi:hypothetical protein